MSYYLDSSIFITYLKKEKEPKQDPGLDYYKGVVDILDNPTKYKIVTSILTFAEVLPNKSYSLKSYNKLCEQIEIVSIAVDIRIAKLAGALRGEDVKKKLKHFDSIHVATAIAYGCERLYSKDADMLNLGNKESIFKIPKVGEIKIIKPSISKYPLVQEEPEKLI